MNKIEVFLAVNNLKQKELAEYLGISYPAVCKIVKSGKLSSNNNVKVMLNDKGWDTSMLTEGEMMYTEDFVKTSTHEERRIAKDKFSADHPTSESDELAWYKRMFQELTRRVMEQDAMLCKLEEKCNELKSRLDEYKD